MNTDSTEYQSKGKCISPEEHHCVKTWSEYEAREDEKLKTLFQLIRYKASR